MPEIQSSLVLPEIKAHIAASYAWKTKKKERLAANPARVPIEDATILHVDQRFWFSAIATKVYAGLPNIINKEVLWSGLLACQKIIWGLSYLINVKPHSVRSQLTLSYIQLQASFSKLMDGARQKLFHTVSLAIHFTLSLK